jgi:hypothetical protein
MRFILTVFILFCVSLVARENPFEAISASTTTGKATYKKDTRENFSSAKMQLPSSARILKSVEFHFQNLDGSIESKKVEVDHKIDWHDELIVKKLHDDITTTTAPTLVSTKKPTNKVKKINFKNLVFFSLDGKSIHVKTKDKRIRDFLVTSPHKIVVDFKREASFYTKVYNLKTRYFKSITLGKHSGYYRVAIELDGKYLYNKQKVKDGYIFTLR